MILGIYGTQYQGDFMKIEDIKVALLRIEGTNCEDESLTALKYLGAKPEHVHLNELIRKRKNLEDYQMLFIPGGFSAGDYIRAGVIFAARIKATIRGDLLRFIEEGKIVLGVCNGFQVLIELGILPGIENVWDEKPEAVLAPNISNRFECRWIYLKKEKSVCPFYETLPDKVFSMPIAHAEGRFMLPENKEEYMLNKIIENGQIAFRYVDRDGNYADYPWNPNGSLYNIAGICNRYGNVIGMMPHPERAFFPYQNLEFKRGNVETPGKYIFDGILKYISRKF